MRLAEMIAQAKHELARYVHGPRGSLKRLYRRSGGTSG